MKMLMFPALIVSALLTLTQAQAQVRTGEDVLRAMHQRYEKTWYESATFTQKTTTYKPDGTPESQTWYEAMLVPGKLRIDLGEPAKNNGYVFHDGKISAVKEGKVVSTRPDINMLLVLGFDVYRQDPETTIKVVKGEGFDLSKLREDTWEGHPVYVVGAEKGDMKSRQFWVDKDTMLFVRELEPAPGDAAKTLDVRFMNYQRLEGGWIAARVEVESEGKKVQTEEYSEIKGNVKLAPATFDPEHLSTTHWEKP